MNDCRGFSVRKISHLVTGFSKHLVYGFAIIALTGCASEGINRSTGEVVDDASIASRLKTALLADRTTDGLDIEVEAYRGRVQLVGFADSQAEIDRAQEIASNIDGVTTVSNALHIVEDSRRVGEFIDDTLLVTRITAALTRNSGVSAINLEVEVNRGIVILGGFVDSAQERNLAGQVTEGVDGVERVINSIELR